MTPIDGYEGRYSITDDGKVYSHLHKGRWLKLQDHNIGYVLVFLFKDGKSTGYLVHRLVAQAFVDNPHDLSEVNHKDGDKKNNHFTNLEWTTHHKNTLHGRRVLGVMTREKHPRAILTEEAVLDIRSNPGKRGYRKVLARKYGVSINTIDAARYGRSWNSKPMVEDMV